MANGYQHESNGNCCQSVEQTFCSCLLTEQRTQCHYNELKFVQQLVASIQQASQMRCQSYECRPTLTTHMTTLRAAIRDIPRGRRHRNPAIYAIRSHLTANSPQRKADSAFPMLCGSSPQLIYTCCTQEIDIRHTLAVKSASAAVGLLALPAVGVLGQKVLQQLQSRTPLRCTAHREQ